MSATTPPPSSFDPASNPAASLGAAPPEVIEARQQFVSLWSRMATTWGISRTMAEVHAWLFVTGGDHHAEAVMDALGISRGNASMTLRRLEDWELIRRVHRRGDRKEYFEAERDVWKMFRTILVQRKKRELDPLLGELDRCRLGPKDDGEAGDALTRRPGDDSIAGPNGAANDDPALAHDRRIDELTAFLEFADAMASQLLGLGASDADGPDARQLAAAAAVGAAVLGDTSDDASPAASRDTPGGDA